MTPTIKILFFATVSVICMYMSGTIEKYNFYMFLLSLFTGSLSVGWFL